MGFKVIAMPRHGQANAQARPGLGLKLLIFLCGKVPPGSVCNQLCYKLSVNFSYCLARPVTVGHCLLVSAALPCPWKRADMKNLEGQELFSIH